MAGAVVGGVIGFIAGLLFSSRKKKNGSSSLSVCGPTKLEFWTHSKGMRSIPVVTSPGDLTSVLLPRSRGGQISDDEFNIPGDQALVLVLENCTIYRWQGDVATGSWVQDPALSSEFQAFKETR